MRALFSPVGLGLVVVGLLIFACAWLATSAAQEKQRWPSPFPQTFEEARTAYQERLDRPSLFVRMRAAERMAAFGEPEGLELLIEHYLDPPGEIANHVRYTAANICAHYYDDEAHLEAWKKWLAEANEPADSWLWVLGQRIRAQHGEAAAVLADVKDRERDVYLRAASLQGLARTGARDATLAAVAAVLEEVAGEEDAVAHAVLVEACAKALVCIREHRETDAFRAAAEQLVAQLDDADSTPPRLRYSLARHLAHIYGVDHVHYDTAAWRRTLAGDESASAADTELHVPTVRFGGITAQAERVVFVVELTDMMMHALTEEELRLIHEAEEQLAEEDRLSFERIINRFEWIQAETVRTIRELPANTQFAVVLFGNEAETLASTPTLRAASEANKQAAVEELQAIRPGPPERRDWASRNGTLMGSGANMHGALKRALQLTTEQDAHNDGTEGEKEEVHLAANAIKHGATTLFVLSRGWAFRDSFMVRDLREPEDYVGEPHPHRSGDEQVHLNYPGPYITRPLHNINHLPLELQRLTLHRKTEIHCVGLGIHRMDPPGFLEKLAAQHRGESRMIYEEPPRRERPQQRDRSPRCSGSR